MINENLTDEEIHAVASLMNKKEFHVYCGYLERILDRCHSALRDQTGEELHRVQGQAQQVARLLDTFTRAHEIAKSIQ